MVDFAKYAHFAAYSAHTVQQYCLMIALNNSITKRQWASHSQQFLVKAQRLAIDLH